MESVEVDIKPRIAILTSRFRYPLTKGDKLRIYHHLKSLSTEFQIFLFCLSEQEPPPEGFESLRPFCERVTVFIRSRRMRLLQLFSLKSGNLPLQVKYFYSNDIKSQLKAELQWIRPDHIHVHLLRMIPYISSLGYKLLEHADGALHDFNFFVIRDKMINAFALRWRWPEIHNLFVNNIKFNYIGSQNCDNRY